MFDCFDDSYPEGQADNKVGIIGAGFVGTACELGFSSMPRTDVCVYDKYLETDSLHRVVNESDILFICLPTPSNEDGSCNTSIIENVVKDINNFAEVKKHIVIKSTVPPGTTRKLADKYFAHNFYFNPEFLTQKNWLADFRDQKLILIGTSDLGNPRHENYEFIVKFYQQFVDHQKHQKGVISVCTFEEAEMAKYTINTFLATKVSFFNEIYEICTKSKVDYDYLVSIIKSDPRIGKSHMNVPGEDGEFGFSGGCFPKDIQALIKHAESNDVMPMMLESAWASNLFRRKNHDWENLPQVTGNYKNRS